MASIPACHAGDRGSIPRVGVDSLLALTSLSSIVVSCLGLYFCLIFVRNSTIFTYWSIPSEIKLNIHWGLVGTNFEFSLNYGKPTHCVQKGDLYTLILQCVFELNF